MKIKICGMREAENIRIIEKLLISHSEKINAQEAEHSYGNTPMMGFIFFPKSPRFVFQKPAYLPSGIERVGLFVNSDTKDILPHIEEYDLSYVQLHGKETPTQCKKLRQRIKIIKAFSIAGTKDVEITQEYEDCCDLYVFDTKCENYGGSGKSFDWSLLKTYKGKTPFLLSGGIGVEHIETLKTLRHPLLAGYDLNSRFESIPGIKNPQLLETFLSGLSIPNSFK